MVDRYLLTGSHAGQLDRRTFAALFRSAIAVLFSSNFPALFGAHPTLELGDVVVVADDAEETC